MDDIREYIENERGKFRLEVWETNKAPELGFCKWRVCIWEPETKSWYALNPSNRYMTLDVALNQGRQYLKTWSEEWTNDLWELV
jgi:hypothetical protein